MGRGTQVGEASAETVTRKNIIVRMQAPRFLVERDEVVLSANVHNYLPSAKQLRFAWTDGNIWNCRPQPTAGNCAHWRLEPLHRARRENEALASLR